MISPKKKRCLRCTKKPWECPKALGFDQGDTGQFSDAIHIMIVKFAELIHGGLIPRGHVQVLLHHIFAGKFLRKCVHNLPTLKRVHIGVLLHVPLEPLKPFWR